MRLKIASRKSDLARWQAVQVARALETLPNRPNLEFIFKASLGDQNLDLPLASLGAKGVFTEDFYQDLVGGACDVVVHSWKDLPVEPRSETQIAMTLPRADKRDVLLIPRDVWTQAESTGHLKILTSSPRRSYNLAAWLPRLLPGAPNIEFMAVRGNVPTRLRRMHELQAGLILAKAGLDRLLEAEAAGFLESGIEVRKRIIDCRFVVLPISLNPPAAAQGALAVEVASSRPDLIAQCRSISDHPTFQAAQRERDILHSHGGGCHQKIGVAILPREYGTVISVKGQTDAGLILNEWRIENETPWSRAINKSAVFPATPSENSWFHREPLQIDVAKLRTRPLLMTARAEAWPEGYVPHPLQVVWAAGVKTWMKLVKKGIWINGCQDGLGESEKMGLEWIAGAKPVTKLTHDRSAQGDDFATYKLKSLEVSPDLSGKSHFFWMSETSFAEAYRRFPALIESGYNSCGPGVTYERLKASSTLKRPIKVFAGFEQFLQDTLP